MNKNHKIMVLEMIDHPNNQIREDGNFQNPNMDHFLLKRYQQEINEKDSLESYTMRKQELENYLNYIGLDGITLAGKEEQKSSVGRYEIYQFELKKQWYTSENESIKEIAILVPSVFKKEHQNDSEFQEFMQIIKLKVGTIQMRMERKHVVLDRRSYYGTIVGKAILIGAAALALGIGIKEHLDDVKRRNMMYWYHPNQKLENSNEIYEPYLQDIENIQSEMPTSGKTM